MQRTLRVLALDVSMRSTGVAITQFSPAGGWQVRHSEVVESRQGESVLQTARLIRERVAPLLAPSAEPVHGCAVEGFMQSFASGGFRTQSLFRLAQLNGIVSFALWELSKRPPIVLMPNRVRSILSVPSSNACKAQEEASVGRTLSSSPLKRTIVRRMRSLDPRFLPEVDEFGEEHSPGDFDRADAAMLGVAACALGFEGIHARGLGGDRLQQPMGVMGKAVLENGSVGARRMASDPRVCEAVGAAWVAALDDVSHASRSGHGKHPTEGWDQGSDDFWPWGGVGAGSDLAAAFELRLPPRALARAGATPSAVFRTAAARTAKKVREQVRAQLLLP
jgi:hypothetical protein